MSLVDLKMFPSWFHEVRRWSKLTTRDHNVKLDELVYTMQALRRGRC